MYKIEYNKDIANTVGTYRNVKGITIDTSDILMMKYVDTIHNGDKNLVTLYLKYLKHVNKHKDESSQYEILNNKPENERIIASIINTNWLINEDSLYFNQDVLEKRKEYFLKEIEFFKDSKKVNDQQYILLMKYFIETLDNVLNEKKYIKKAQ